MKVLLALLLSYILIFISGFAMGSVHQLRRSLAVLNKFQRESSALFERYRNVIDELMAMITKAKP